MEDRIGNIRVGGERGLVYTNWLLRRSNSVVMSVVPTMTATVPSALVGGRLKVSAMCAPVGTNS